MPKRRRLAAPAPVDDAVAIPTPVDDAVAGFNIVAALMDAELPFYDLVLHLPAKDSARLAQTDRRSRQLLMDPATARWCAESRRSLLASRNVPGDLPLAPINCDWSLERLHLCEHPPRFPQVYFASPMTGSTSARRPRSSGSRRCSAVTHAFGSGSTATPNPRRPPPSARRWRRPGRPACGSCC